MRGKFNKIHGRIGVIAAIVLVLAALALYFYSERAVPPVSDPATPEGQSRVANVEPENEKPRPVGASEPDNPRSDERGPMPGEGAGAESLPPARDGRGEDSAASPTPEVSLERAQQRLREDLQARLAPGQIERVVEDRLLERLVTTLNSLDGEPVPLRFRPLDHVPDLPRLEETGEHWTLPGESDPRYRPYRAMFDRLDAVELAELFDYYEPALEQAWQAMGEDSTTLFRSRLIEVLEHLAEFDLPPDRPAVHQPEVLYEYIDPSLEQLSWGRKALIRIGPEHAPEVQRKLGALADQLRRRGKEMENDIAN